MNLDTHPEIKCDNKKSQHKLTDLLLNHNSITDISPLAGLNKLTDLWLDHNSITDISPLAGLNKLTRLLLDDNFITDIYTTCNFLVRVYGHTYVCTYN